MNNLSIKQYAKKKGVRLWQLADSLSISEATLTRLLRHELPEEKYAELRSVIDRISAEII